jgi:hypothetical protein
MSTTGATHTDASTAARLLVQRRWGRTRVNALIAELHDRAAELGPVQVAELRELVDDAASTEEG